MIGWERCGTAAGDRGDEGLRIAGLAPVVLAPKEGLAMLNGTQVSTALALRGLFSAQNLLAAGIVAGAMSVECRDGERQPFDPRIHELRGQCGADRGRRGLPPALGRQ
jgi:histidine ammonia-lyase